MNKTGNKEYVIYLGVVRVMKSYESKGMENKEVIFCGVILEVLSVGMLSEQRFE